jgi:hypothetical protein
MDAPAYWMAVVDQDSRLLPEAVVADAAATKGGARRRAATVHLVVGRTERSEDIDDAFFASRVRRGAGDAFEANAEPIVAAGTVVWRRDALAGVLRPDPAALWPAEERAGRRRRTDDAALPTQEPDLAGETTPAGAGSGPPAAPEPPAAPPCDGAETAAAPASSEAAPCGGGETAPPAGHGGVRAPPVGDSAPE